MCSLSSSSYHKTSPFSILLFKINYGKIAKTIANIALLCYTVQKAPLWLFSAPVERRKLESMESTEPYFTHLHFHFSCDEKPDPAAYERHFHEFYVLIYLYRGIGTYMVEGARYDLRPGTLLLLRPGEFHYVALSPDHPYERFVLHFARTALGSDADTILKEFNNAPLGDGSFYAAPEVTEEVQQTILRFRELSRLPKDKSEAMARLLLGQLLIALSEIPHRPSADTEALGARAIRYLGEHITDPFSLDTLAHQLLVSKFYLCRAFKDYNGISIRSYLLRKRILLAKNCLAAGKKPAEAADAAGFSDYSSFYRAYKKITGHSPKCERTNL